MITRKKSNLRTAKKNLVSDKIEHLVESGEVPNTPQGRKRAAGMAYGMADAQRLKPGGVYVPVKKRGGKTSRGK